MDKHIKRILPRVQKPARYTGGEYNAVIKDKKTVDFRMALCFPDTYEIGMSNLGVRIIYGISNALESVWCERVFSPWGDMEAEMRSENISLWAIESGDPVSEFDLVAFSVGYEMAYTNVLNILDLAGIPVRTNDRNGNFPLIIAGGICTSNPEPLCDFVDLFVVGEGEEVIIELLEVLREAKNTGLSKDDTLERASKLGGIYVPDRYDIRYNPDGTLDGITPRDGAPAKVTKRIVEDFESSYFPVNPIVPSTEIVHDRVTLEVFRGCIRGCRFCQAGFACRPVRERSAKKLVEQGVESLKNTGYQEISLSSLSTSDYRELGDLCDGLLDYCEARSINLSLPSLRADNFSYELMNRVSKVRKSGMTFAPEAGSQRLRDAINKNVTEEEILNTCKIAFEGGWNSVKLYFMLGLPTETDEDVLGIAELSEKVLHTYKRYSTNKSRGIRITVSTSCFIPKPHTPFQWEAQVTREEYMRRVQLLRDNMRSRAITYNWHDAETSYIEAVLARGDRRLGNVIEKAWRLGAKLESWSEYFSMDIWTRAFEECGVDPDFYALRQRSGDELLPWSHIDMGVSAAHLLSEREAALESKLSPDCREKCLACGAAVLLKGGRCDA